MSTALANYTIEFLKLWSYKVRANDYTRRGCGQMGDNMWTASS